MASLAGRSTSLSTVPHGELSSGATSTSSDWRRDYSPTPVIDIETSDAIITKTAALLASDPKSGSALSSVAKVHCSDAENRIIDRSVQLCGGDGVSDALPLAQFVNEVRPFRTYDGSNETHRWAIARRAAAGRAEQVEQGEPTRDQLLPALEERT